MDVSLPRIAPRPPVADVSLPWDAEMDDPVAALADARSSHGDTFVVDGPTTRTLFLFSPVGVASFYGLAEEQASKGVADWQMLLRKLPDELFDGRRTMPHDLFGRDEVRTYLDQLDASIEVSLAELGERGSVDLFAWSRRLGHRMGLASWAGERPSGSPRFDRMVAALDTLDGSAAFVHPDRMRAVAASGKRDERNALAKLEEMLAETVARRDAQAGENDLFGGIVARWNDVEEPHRSTGVARDVVLVHLGSMSNLFAAMGWMLAHLALHPGFVERLRANESGLAERCALESTRIGQRSIMLRTALRPTEVRDEHQVYRVEPGAQIATLLPLTNLTALPGLEHYDPDRWRRRHLADEADLPARELVTTFGHGSHTCPAQPFSLAAMVRTAERVVGRYELSPLFDRVEPLAAQIGGVARTERPCVVGFETRDSAREQ